MMEDEMTTTKEYLNPVESGAATVIARKPCRAGSGHIVLCFLGLDNPTPYVVWLEFVSQGRTVYEHGDYFHQDDILEAAKAFAKR
jgi:hypothetical protein